MLSLPSPLSRLLRSFYRHLRQAACHEMFRLASGWVPAPLRRNERQAPIRLNFAIPKKHRLAWISRSITPRPR